MITSKDIHQQFLTETGDRTPTKDNFGTDIHKKASTDGYILWLEEKLLEEWNS